MTFFHRGFDEVVLAKHELRLEEDVPFLGVGSVNWVVRQVKQKVRFIFLKSADASIVIALIVNWLAKVGPCEFYSSIDGLFHELEDSTREVKFTFESVALELEKVGNVLRVAHSNLGHLEDEVDSSENSF